MSLTLGIAAAAFAAALAAGPAPAGAASADVGLCRFDLGADRAGVAEALAESCAARGPEIFAELGVRRPDDSAPAPVTIRVVSEPAEISAKLPAGVRAPPWAVAIAVPGARLVVLALRDREGRPVERLDVELEHELSHVALRDAVGGADVPRWLSEGIAIQQSERSSMARRGSLLIAAIGGNVPALGALHDYPSGAAAVALAYAQAADFVGYLLGEGGWHGVRVALNRLRHGDDLDAAFRTGFGKTAGDLEARWRSGVISGTSWVAAVTGSGALWGLATILFALAYVQARRRRRRRFAEMGEAENAIERFVREAEEGDPGAAGESNDGIERVLH
jgi:hypothetical protein